MSAVSHMSAWQQSGTNPITMTLTKIKTSGEARILPSRCLVRPIGSRYQSTDYDRFERKVLVCAFFPTIRFLNRGVLPVKFFTRGLVVFVLGLGMLGMVGCGADNESEGQQLAKSAGDPGKPDPKAVGKAGGPMPKSPEEHYQNQMKNNSLKDMGYPGAAKQK
jgi:hypothetical protein